jgi:predicted esterase
MRRSRQSAATETLAVALLFTIGLAIAGPDAVAEPPAPLCAGCLLEAAARPGPTPLVVLLHGDGESAPARAAMWRRWLRPRGFALLSLACPVALGCKGSFWRWDGDPAWLDAQVEAAARRLSIDRERVFLIGWSGGASYMGWRVHALSRSFAALVFHGGGMAPPRGDDGRPAQCGSPPRPALFLVGDKNPLHHLAQSLRKALAACQHEVAWRLLPGADHDGERAALSDPKKVTEVLDWLQSHPRGSAASQSPP